jgi:hypothetical protein
LFDYATQRKFLMRKYVLPTLVSLALSGSLALADNNTTDAGGVIPPPPPAAADITLPPPPPAMPDMPAIPDMPAAMPDMTPPTPPAMPDMTPPEPPKSYKEMMEQQKALMEKQKAQMEEVQKLVEQLRKATDPNERKRLMDEMQQQRQKMYEQRRQDRGMTPPAYRPRQGYARNWNRPMPKYGYGNRQAYRSLPQHRAIMEERVEKIEKKLDEILKLLKDKK